LIPATLNQEDEREVLINKLKVLIEDIYSRFGALDDSVYDFINNKVLISQTVTSVDSDNTSDSNNHARLHNITSTGDHSSGATSGQMLKANSNGLPIDATNTDTEVSDAVTKKHDRSHALNSTDDHTSSIVEDNVMTGDANGLPKDSGIAIEDATNVWERTGTTVESVTSGDTVKSTGGIIRKTRQITSATTLLTTDEVVYIDTAGGGFNVNLPAGVEGQHFVIAHVGGDALTITPNGSETIFNYAGGVAYTLLSNEVLELYYNATEGWWGTSNRRSWGVSSGGTGNFSSFESDGTYLMTNDATVWDDLQLGISNIRVPVANAPADRLYAFGIGGGVTFPVKGFDVNEYIYFDAQTSHSMKLNTILDHHIHFTLPNTTNIGDKFQFQLDVIAAGINTQWAVPSGSPYTSEHIIMANDDTYHRFLGVAHIAASNDTVSSVYHCKLTRIAATSSEYGSEVYLSFTDCHYEKDTIGSRQENSK